MFLKEVSVHQGCIYLIKIQKNSNIVKFISVIKAETHPKK